MTFNFQNIALVRQQVSSEAEVSMMPTAMASGKDSRVWASVSQQDLFREESPAPEGKIGLKFQKWQEAMLWTPHGCGVSGACSEPPSPYPAPPHELAED